MIRSEGRDGCLHWPLPLLGEANLAQKDQAETRNEKIIIQNFIVYLAQNCYRIPNGSASRLVVMRVFSSFIFNIFVNVMVTYMIRKDKI